MAFSGRSVAKLDILLHDPMPNKQNFMDLTTDSGFCLALTAILNMKFDNSFCVIGLLCSSFVAINAGTHLRSLINPLGDESRSHVRLGNCLASRVALLLMALQAVGAAWMVEQPISSLAWYHPRLRRILRTFTKVYVCRWWMGHYKSCTPKRHICWSNSKKIGGLDRGSLTKDQRKEIRRTGVKSAKVKTNKKGKKSYSGTSSLRATGTYPPHFGLRLVKLFPFLVENKSPAPEIPASFAEMETKDFFDGLPWGDDVWEDADMVSCLAYVRGNRDLNIGEWRDSFPEALTALGELLKAVASEYEKAIASLKQQNAEDGDAEATEAELAAARKKSAMDPKNLKKTNPPKNDARSKDRDVASKSKSQTHVAPVAKKTVPAPSSAPAGPSQPSKRHRSKSSPLDASTPADDLAKVNKDLMSQLAAMQKKLDAATKGSDSSRASVKTPMKTPSNPKRRAPSPVTASEGSSDADASGESEDGDKGCEGSDKEPTDAFLTRLVRQSERLNKSTRTKKRRWLTEEMMRTTLGWSKYPGFFKKIAI
ncbi:unnamed protein product [Cladocopium goreaui]|uniref:Uncharacterized protein n=1 Tax=Cladocopium goreaui TaxID=2562237 RepID=A0A9P1CI01_9DINO|nr:unnamed protein product [Cladocopium goreaui]